MGWDALILEVDTGATYADQTVVPPRKSAALELRVELLKSQPAPAGTGGGRVLTWRVGVTNTGPAHAMTAHLEAFDVSVAAVAASNGSSSGAGALAAPLRSVDSLGRDCSRFPLPLGHISPHEELGATLLMETRVQRDGASSGPMVVRVRVSANGGSVRAEREFTFM